MSNIRCAAWRVSLSNGESFVRDYATPQPEAVGEVFEPKPRRRRTPRPAAATAEATRPPSSHIAPAEIPDELARWCWSPLLTEITRAHFEGRR